MGNYQRLNVSFVKGDSVYLFDNKGRKYLDALSGIAVCGLGHAHPKLVELLTNRPKTCGILLTFIMLSIKKH